MTDVGEGGWPTVGGANAGPAVPGPIGKQTEPFMERTPAGPALPWFLPEFLP